MNYLVVLFLLFGIMFSSCSVVKKRYSPGYSVHWKKTFISKKRKDSQVKTNPHNLASRISKSCERNPNEFNLFTRKNEVKVIQPIKQDHIDSVVNEKSQNLQQLFPLKSLYNTRQPFAISKTIRNNINVLTNRTQKHTFKSNKVDNSSKIDTVRLKKNAKILLWVGLGIYAFGLVFLVIETNELLMAILIGSGSLIAITGGIMALVAFIINLARKN